ncbi:MAG: YdcF family protein [Burkholderiaceae bacterium]
MISTMPEYIFVLGAPNDEFGVLSDIARERIQAAADYYLALRESPRFMILAVTGGYGTHFNCAALPHRVYANRDLVQLGVPRSALIEDGFMTSNTIEDVIAITDYIDMHHIANAKVVTSHFHVARARLILECVRPPFGLPFIEAKDPADLDSGVYEHERVSIGAILEQGGVRYGTRFYPVPRSQSSAQISG